PSEEAWKERMAKFGERDYGLVACVEGEIVGMLSLQVSPRLRRAHVGDLGMVVHDQWAGKGGHRAHESGHRTCRQLVQPLALGTYGLHRQRPGIAPIQEAR